ncbi:uncharacterized protein LOC123555063 isoform X2 [Mercenaria mercenaria]|nr:uncharacterized protein LOC123555063 isoform X2 [Mercenaria mercenaria]
MFHIELCDVVKRCSENVICYLERYSKHGRQTFRSGCLSQEVCANESETAGNDPNRCVDCCSGSYCNYKGCGETGLPSRDQRGPLCYDCEYAFSPNECDTLKLCDQGQVCSIKETRWGTHSNFKMGCAHAPCSPVQRSVHVLPRSTPTCQACCSEDYCNLNCTMGSGHGQPVIVG